MKNSATSLALLCALLFSLASGIGLPAQAQASNASGDQFVYADFQNGTENRPVSSRGGLVQLSSYQESTPSRFKGLANSNPPAPELVRLKADDPNRAIAFDYELYSPNQYAGVGVEVQGQPQKDGKMVADDMSGYKYLSLQIYATGVPSLRLEIVNRGQGINMTSGFPQSTFKIKPGFNIYKIPLNTLSQPSWVETKVSAKDVLKKLTAINLTTYCEGCTPVKGTVVVDNIVFQK